MWFSPKTQPRRAQDRGIRCVTACYALGLVVTSSNDNVLRAYHLHSGKAAFNVENEMSCPY